MKTIKAKRIALSTFARVNGLTYACLTFAFLPLVLIGKTVDGFISVDLGFDGSLIKTLLYITFMIPVNFFAGALIGILMYPLYMLYTKFRKSESIEYVECKVFGPECAQGREI